MTEPRSQEGTPLIPSNLHVPEDCRAVSEILARVGDKWTVLVVGVLGDGPKRFSEIRRALGSISQRMLTRNLRQLESNGLVSRRVMQSKAIAVEYSLTGRTLVAPLGGMCRWAERYRKDVMAEVHVSRPGPG